ncbi:MAG: hypothetical protein AAGE84_18560, partial [Cyanobacteria bacterium P01_G01_bin.39]
VWSDLNSEELSLGSIPQTAPSLDSSAKVNRVLVKQLNNHQQQLIAQVWSDLNSEELSLGSIPQTAPSLDSSAKVNRVLVKQLNNQQQQLIAQVWSDLNSEELSLATSPQNLPDNNTANTVDLLLVKQLDDQQQQLIAQVWSDLNSEELSLASDSENTSSLIVSKNADDSQELSINELNNQQQVIAQNWSDFEDENLSFAEPNTDLKLSPAAIENIQPSQPAKEPIINPPDKREIAARLALQKVQIIAPAPGVILSDEHNDSVTIQYPAETLVKLEVNGAELDDSLITQQQLDSKRNLITQTWKGADLRNGENTLDIIAQKDGFKSKTSREVLVQNSTTLRNAVQPETASNPESTAPENPTNQSTAKAQPQGKQPESKSVKILSPTANAILDRIHSSVIIQYPQGASVVLQVNGKSVDAGQVGHTTVHPVSKIVTQTWYGVIFDTGVNTLSVLSTTDRVNYNETSIQITVPGRPEAIALETVEAEVPADGQSVATIKGRYIDQHGTTTPWNEVITLQSNGGQFLGNDLDPDEPGFQLKPANGEFTASLQAGYNAKQVRILATSSNLESYTQTKFKTTLREKPLLTGFADFRLGARGTDFYDSYRDFLPLDEDNDTEFDVTAAGFIQGSWGQWSYTGAFHSDRPINEDPDGENRLFQTYNPSEFDYPVYGDDSSVEATTPSIDNVYFRLEKNPIIEFANPDYFMWGDFDTKEFATEAQEFGAISRQLHGFKFNYNLGNLQLNGLYANNVEGFQRDSISPDGTSGFYFLSRRLLIPGSEDVYIELTPLNNPGEVVFRERLSLGTDYEIDYERGTLLFSDPVLNTEIDGNGDILVRRIVTTYQFESEAMDSNIFAGRGQYHFDRNPDTPSWLGTSYLIEDRGDQDFSLWSVDSYISLGTWGSISGEYANSSNETVFAEADGSAYHLEGEVKFSDHIRSYAYYSQADEGFANNATLSFIPGQIRYGTQLNAQVSDSTSLRFSYEHQDNEGVAPRPLDELEEFLDSTTVPVPGDALDNTLDSITAGVEQKIGSADLGLDLIWRNRTDNKSPEALDSTSTQLRSQFSIPITSTLDFHALNDLTLSNNTDSVFSDRIGFGLDWEFYSGLSLVVSQQWFTRGNLAGEALTSVGLTGEYEPWHNGTITGRYNVTNGESGMRNVGSVGIHQKIAIAPGLLVDLDYENTFDGFENTGSGQQFAQPFTVGQSASALGFGSGSSYSVGVKYNDNPNFTADAQWQHSDRSEGGNTVWYAGITGKLTKSLTSLLSFNQASSANQVFDIGTTRRLRLGLAYRNPENDTFNALLRYEYEEDGGTIPETLLIGEGTGTQEHLFGIETIYAPHWRWEFYSKYAFRNSKTFLADNFVGSSNVSLGQLRATYRLNYHFDLVTEGRMIWQPSAGFSESGFIVEAGYYATPELRLSAGYVFGEADDEDFSGTRSAGGPYVGVTVKLNGLLDGFGQNRPPELPEGVAQQELKESEEIGKVGIGE